MNVKFNVLFRCSFVFSPHLKSNSFRSNSHILTPSRLFGTAEKLNSVDIKDRPKDSTDVLMKWGCSEADISRIFTRRPSLRSVDIDILESNLKSLNDIGVHSSELANILYFRPSFLNSRIEQCWDERLEYLRTWFDSNELLHRAILRDPSLLTCDFHGKVKPTLEMYEKVGVSRKELASMLMLHPTMIARSTFDEEKMELIRRTEVSRVSRMYKYVVTVFAISRTKTIWDKVANLERFGFSEDEVLLLIGRSPYVLSLSTDKVQRNMTFILRIMKLPATTVLKKPFLLLKNLENLLKPRFLLGGKIEDMGLDPRIKGPRMLTALRMTEDRFIRAFINCHPEDVAQELMEFYSNAKCVKRIAESSKKSNPKGFPF